MNLLRKEVVSVQCGGTEVPHTIKGEEKGNRRSVEGVIFPGHPLVALLAYGVLVVSEGGVSLL